MRKQNVLIKIDLHVRHTIILPAHETTDIPFTGVIIRSIRKKQCSKKVMYNFEVHAMFDDFRKNLVDGVFIAYLFLLAKSIESMIGSMIYKLIN